MKGHTIFLSLALTILASSIAGCGPTEPASASPPQPIDTGVDPETWALIPAGKFLLGQHDHETTVGYDYEMMVTDVTNAQYAQYLNGTLAAGAISIKDGQVMGPYRGDEFHGHEHEEEILPGDYAHLSLIDENLRLDYDGTEFAPKPGYENHPMVMVTWFGAKAYCDFNAWRLPTEVEWEKAARGPDGRPFPWGDDIARNNANHYSSHDLYEKIVGGLGDTTPVGFFNDSSYEGYQTLDSPSPYGLCDMAGNVWQWTGDVYEGTHMRHMRGGSKADYAYNLRVWTRDSAGPTYASTSVGFRCARDS